MIVLTGDMEAFNPTAVEKFLSALPEKAMNLGIRIVFALLFFFIGVQVIKLIRRIVRKSMTRASVETGAIQFVDSFIKAAMYVILVFLLASYFGVDAASIVALVGSAGVAVGLAVQGSLSNLAGGVLILLLKPFKVGDYIIENGSRMEGTVSEIQIFYTKLTTADNKVIVLPNGNLANTSLTNVSACDKRRVDIAVGISYQADIKAAKAALEKVIEADESSLKDEIMLVYVDSLGDSSVNLGVRLWVASADYWTAKWRITENCKLALDKAGIEIPFPQVDVHMK